MAISAKGSSGGTEGNADADAFDLVAAEGSVKGTTGMGYCPKRDFCPDWVGGVAAAPMKVCDWGLGVV